MTQVLEYVKIALMNIKSNKGRSFLTMLGIIIGISSVIMVMAIGNGVRGQVNDELESLGGGQIAIYVDSAKKETTVAFTQDDFDLIMGEVDHVKAVTASYNAYGTAEGPKGDFDATLSGGNEGLQYASSDPIVKGKYFSKGDAESGNKVCVITENSAITLFGTTDVIGMSFDVTLYGITQELTIVGIRQDNASSIVNMMMGEPSLQVEVPLTVLGYNYGYWIEDFSQFYIVAESSEYSADVAKEAVNILENKYNVRGESQILVQSFTDLSSQFDSILGVITIFISFVAAISLLVGGIGVMNIMLVSVTERTREIGIRKALGARTGSILLQFLAEAGIITLMGGVIGILLGILGANIVCAIAGITARTQISTILGATVFSSAVGLFFGIYPAKKAAKLSPIEALRHE
ncbi:putative ABC transport system permease protein [Kineothrix alysoides]|uniref:Putative ABC transport system permease protein n=1 Tax=Kineothrix alysoides TaxID=1469948 RepID=A0A4R1QVA9_9FIRM|nr:ABC transporter permease [Kineothrix alysoides]TCL57899.1 putative ABC transport system permease protein [Kineothrix alysoides]